MTSENKIMGGIILVSLVVLVGGAFMFNKNEVKITKKLKMGLMGEKIPDQGAIHVKKGAMHEKYNSNPPTSGPHWAGVAGPGIKNTIVPDELMLHSMEHGAAVVWYQNTLSKEDINKIKVAFKSASGKKIMLPRKNLNVPVALTSWNYLLKLKNIDTGIIKEFIETNNDRAPEKAPI